MASTTPNLALRLWDGIMDRFSRTELVTNFQNLDTHDHSGAPKGVQIPTNGLANNAVTTAKLADGATTTAKIVDGSVTSAKLAPPEGWTNATLASQYISFTTGSEPPVGFYKDVLGIVHLRGRLTTTVDNQSFFLATPFVLPVGYRPAADVNGILAWFITSQANDTTPSNSVCRVDIRANGTVLISAPAPTGGGGDAGSTPVRSVLSFNNIHFRAA